MAYGTRAGFDAIRTLAFGGISGTYAAVGSATTDHARVIRFVNSTNVDVFISLDGAIDHIRLASGSFLLVDFTANKVRDDGLFISVGTIFYTKGVSELGGPASGAVWIEVISAVAGGV